MYRQPQKSSQNNVSDPLEGFLYLNRALTYEVFSSLRAVLFKWDVEKLYIFFFCDGEISEDDYESAQCIATQMIANFNNFLLDVEIIRLDYPSPVPEIGVLAYHRYESGVDFSKEQEQVKKLLMQNTAIAPRIKMLIAVIVGSLGGIFSTLRSLQIKSNNKSISLCFYTEGEVSQTNLSLLELITSYVASCLPDCAVQYENFRWDYPKEIPTDNTTIVYFRKEYR